MTRGAEEASHEARAGPVLSAGAAIITTAVGGTILSFNPAAERLTGYNAADLVGARSITMLHTPAELDRRAESLGASGPAARFGALVAQARRGGHETRAWTYERADGLPIQALVTVSSTRDEHGALVGYVFVAQQSGRLIRRERDPELLAQIVDSSRDAILCASLDGHILSWNAAAARLFGYAREEIIGRHVAALVPAERRHEFVTGLRRLRGQADALVLQTVRVRKDGEAVPVELRMSPVLDGEGVLQGVSILASPRGPDDAEPRSRDGAGARAEQRYRMLVESSASLAAIVGLDGYFKLLNPMWASVLGFSEEELLRRPVLEFVAPEDRQRTIEEGRGLASVANTMSINIRTRFLCADGGRRWLSWNANSDLESGFIYGIAHDITELVETRERLRRSEGLLRETGRMARLGGWEYDVVRDQMRWSEVVHELHEVGPGYVPTVEGALEFYDPDDRPRIRDAVRGAVEGGDAWDAELAFTTARGRKLWIRTKGEAERDGADGPVVRLRGMFQDITERKELDRLKDEFVSVVSHELRTPLTSIRGSLRLIEGGLTGPVTGETMTLVKVASSNCERLVRMINDILDLDRIEHGSLRLSRATIDIGGLIQEAAREQAQLAGERRVSVTTEVTPGLRTSGDRDRLLQVLTNLLSNAIKFSAAGTTVRVVGSRPAGGGARVTVIDQGAGIAASERVRVFEKFRQLDASDSRRVGGSGLGLAICKGLIALHGGRIGVESALGEGSAFWFEIPGL